MGVTLPYTKRKYDLCYSIFSMYVAVSPTTTARAGSGTCQTPRFVGRQSVSLWTARATTRAARAATRPIATSASTSVSWITMSRGGGGPAARGSAAARPSCESGCAWSSCVATEPTQPNQVVQAVRRLRHVAPLHELANQFAALRRWPPPKPAQLRERESRPRSITVFVFVRKVHHHALLIFLIFMTTRV